MSDIRKTIQSDTPFPSGTPIMDRDGQFVGVATGDAIPLGDGRYEVTVLHPGVIPLEGIDMSGLSPVYMKPQARIPAEDVERAMQSFDEALRKAEDMAAQRPDLDWTYTFEQEKLPPFKVTLKIVGLPKRGENDE